MNESQNQKYIVNRLRAKHFFVFSVPNEQKIKPSNGYAFIQAQKSLGLVTGIPDLGVWNDPRVTLAPHIPQFFFIEVKSKNGVLSHAQKEVHNQLTELGCPVFVFKTVEEFEKHFFDEDDEDKKAE